MGNHIQYEEDIVVKDLFASFLRRWWLFLVGAVVGGLLLGGYQLLSNTMREPELVMTEEEILEAEAQIEDREASIEDYKEEIETLRSDLKELRAEQKVYEAILEELEARKTLDAEMLTVRLAVDDKIMAIREKITSGTDRIDKLRETIPDIRDEIEELTASKEEVVEWGWTDGVVAKGIVGGAMGFVLVLVWLLFRYYADKTLRSPVSLTERFGLPVLGALYASQSKGLFGPLANRLAGTPETVDAQHQLEIAASKIQLLAGPDRMILITGTSSMDTIEPVFTGLRACLPKDYELLLAENPTTHPEVLLQKRICGLVLVEKVHGSNVEALGELLNFLQLNDIPVLGAVAV